VILSVRRVTALAIVSLVSLLWLEAEDKPSPRPSGPQSDGVFHKVVLDSDRDTDADGTIEDTLVDPMEIAVASDGRVFTIERAGVVKIWKPETRQTVVAGRLEVFKELEDGLIGLALDPRFSENGWVYLTHSDPQTRTNASGNKEGDNLVSRFTLRGDTLDPPARRCCG
jgi:glucose/arabinose dehydrogenase